jgi:hypothetical protein
MRNWVRVLLLFIGGLGCRREGDASTRASVRPATHFVAVGAAPSARGNERFGVFARADGKANDLIRAAREQLPLSDADPKCVPATRHLAQVDPELLLVVARLRAIELGRFARACLQDERLAETLRTSAAPDVFVSTLEAPIRWRFESQLPWTEAARWLLENSEQTFARANPKRLVPLLAAPHLADEGMKSGLLVALIHLDAKVSRTLLAEWAPRLSRPDARFVTLFMREHPLSLVPGAWIDETEEPCRERRTRAVFDGVRSADRSARRTLLAYLDATDTRWSTRPLAVRRFVDAVIRIGAPRKDFTCRDALGEPCRMTSSEGGMRIEEARNACLSAARAWLRSRGGN